MGTPRGPKGHPKRSKIIQNEVLGRGLRDIDDFLASFAAPWGDSGVLSGRHGDPKRRSEAPTWCQEGPSWNQVGTKMAPKAAQEGATCVPKDPLGAFAGKMV